MRSDIARGALLFGVLLLSTSPVRSAEPKSESEPGMNPEMAKWMELAVPGPHHAQLAALEGTWNVTGKVWWDPSQPPSEGKGTAVQRLILGGRFLESRVDSDFGGMPMQGVGISGYDNYTKKHISFWIDSMGTMMTFTEGTCVDNCGIVTERGEMPDVISGGSRPYRMVTRRVTKDQYVSEMYSTGPDGKESKSMELTYQRAGS